MLGCSPHRCPSPVISPHCHHRRYAPRQVLVWADCEGQDEGDGAEDPGHGGGKEAGVEEGVGGGGDMGENVSGWHEMEDKPAEEVSGAQSSTLI